MFKQFQPEHPDLDLAERLATDIQSDPALLPRSAPLELTLYPWDQL